MNSGLRAGLKIDVMTQAHSRPVVHLELHTADLPGAGAFYAGLCGWRPERIELDCGSYLALDLGGPGHALDGGIVECEARRPLWLP